MEKIIKRVGRCKSKQEIFVILFCITIFFMLAQDCWAIIIDHVSGDIYAETYTNYMTGSRETAAGWEASGGVFTDPNLFDDTTGRGSYGYASGQKINGESGDNHARFILSSTSQSATGMTGQAFETYSVVRTGPQPGDMIEFVLTPEPGEEGLGVELIAKAVLAGTLNSSGLTFLNPLWESGIAEVNFRLEIYKDPGKEPISRFVYDSTAQNVAPTTLMEKSVRLPGDLGTQLVDSFVAGDTFYVFFEQLATATVSASLQCSAKAFAVQSTNDVITIAIEANPTTRQADPIATPEPSTFILLSLALIGILSAGGGISLNKD